MTANGVRNSCETDATKSICIFASFIALIILLRWIAHTDARSQTAA
jgi:hypothetical protein